MIAIWRDRLYPCVLIGLGLLVGTALYLILFPGLRAPYLFAVLLHAGIGLLVIPPLLVYLWCHLRLVFQRQLSRGGVGSGVLAMFCLLLCVLFGLSLIMTGATRPHRLELWLHEAGGVGLVLGLLFHLLRLSSEAKRAGASAAPLRWAALSTLAAFVLIGVVDLAVSRMKDEGLAHADVQPVDFSPSLAATASGGLIPSAAFLDAGACERCHTDTYHQWQGSAHHFASFNNPFYRRSVEYAAQRVGYAPTKFCGACHDPLLLFSGQMDGPIDLSRPEAQAGITCQVCHGITGIRDVRGNGSYTIAPPGQYPFAGSRSTLLRGAHDLMVRLKPGPHREAMLKPFHRSPEFCSVCHKVHIPEAVNHFKWIRGQDEYDHWHQSGVSGNAVMSWTPPNPSPKICRDCHMPPIGSNEFGAKRRPTGNLGDGRLAIQKEEPYTIRDHRFLAANTALPSIDHDPAQLDATEKFLKDKKISVELVALDPSPLTPEPLPCLFPLASCAVSAGDTVELHVLVRNLGVGHTFPGGTNDTNEAWLDVSVKDGRGHEFYRSGLLEANGDVDPDAHFYKAVLLDRDAQLINKRNVHDWVSTLYARTIPPGGSDVARYRMTIPRDAGDHMTVEVRLRYRKFMNWFSRFVFAGQRVQGQAARVDAYVDETRWTFDKTAIPDFPIVDVAESQTVIPVALPGTPAPVMHDPLPLPEEIVTRVNSYGIGLLLQRDTRRAGAVFDLLTARAPQVIEGQINLARTQLAEGEIDDAEGTLRRALALDHDYPKALYLMGTVQRQRGDYEQALALFRRVEGRYPKDGVLCNEIAQLYYLEGRYQEAIAELQRGLAIDPENLSANYYLMLSYRALGDQENARAAEARYLRYKPDESITELTGDYQRRHQEAGLEAQPAHVHE